MKWENYQLKDIAKYWTGKVEASVLDASNYISTENLIPDRGGLVNSNYVPTTGNANSYSENDVLISNIRPYFKKIWFADKEGGCSNDVLVFRPNENVEPLFLYYQLSKDAFFNDMVAGSNGTKMPRGNKTSIMQFKLQIPPLPTQRKIASILSAYDDLIENNLKRIKLFEEKAAITYREIISSGQTETKFFEDFCSIIHGYAFKSTDFSEDKTFDIVVRMGNFKEGGGVQFENNTKFLNENFEYSPKYKLKTNDLVMVLSDVTREGRIIGNVGFIPSNSKTYLLNQRVGKIVSDEKYRQWLYATFNSKEFKDYCLSCANSATVLNFNNKDLFKFKIRLPKEKELKEFTKKVKPIYNLIGNLGEQNTNLRVARDLLLPKLMSGQIEV